MLVKVLKTHYNEFGDAYEKKADDVYDHPSPRTLIERKAVEEHDGPAPRTRRRRKKA
jgi:hypothetical protein